MSEVVYTSKVRIERRKGPLRLRTGDASRRFSLDGPIWYSVLFHRLKALRAQTVPSLGEMGDGTFARWISEEKPGKIFFQGLRKGSARRKVSFLRGK